MTSLFQIVFIISVTTSLVILPLKLCSHQINRNFVVKWKYWIWLLLALRLLIPWNPSFPVHTVQIEPPSAVTSPVQTLPAPAVRTVSNVPGNPEPTILPGADISQPISAGASPFTILDLMAWIWLLGILLFACGQLLGYLRFRRRIFRWGRPVRNEELLNLLQTEAASISVAAPKFYISSAASGPMVIGLFRPALILPDESFSRDALTLILRHELTHLKRRDLWYKLLLLAANAVHWFNPVVYWMTSEARNDLELSCDHLVIRELDDENRRLYSETILQSLCRSQQRTSPLSTGFRDGTKVMKERFRGILEHRTLRAGRTAFLAVLTCTLLAGGLISCGRSGTRHTIFAPGVDDSTAITLSVELPENWSFQLDDSEDAYRILNQSGDAVGSAAFQTFDWYPEAEFYVAVYNSIMLGSVANWNNEYTPVKSTEFTETATCRPWFKVPEEGKSMAETEEQYYKGILSYDKQLLCFVMLSFDEQAITDEQLTQIAESLTLSAAGSQEKDVYTPEEALVSLESELIRNGSVEQGLLAADGRMLHWDTNQMYVTYLGSARALFVSLRDEQGNLFGEYAARLDRKGFFRCLDQTVIQIGGMERYQKVMGKWQPANALSAGEAVEALKRSIHLDEQTLCFQLPALYPDSGKWNIHIAGRQETDGMGMSLHFLEDTVWQAGETYQIPVNGSITELTMEIQLEAVSAEIDLMPYLQGMAADLVTVEGLAKNLSDAWLATWYAMDGPKSGRTEEVPQALSFALDLNGDEQKEIGILCNGSLQVSGDSAWIAFYQLTDTGFEEYAVLEGLPWLSDHQELDVYQGSGKTILRAIRPEVMGNGTLYHDCYYVFDEYTLTTIDLPRLENTDGSIWYFDNTGSTRITEEKYNALTEEITEGTKMAIIQNLYYQWMESELFTAEAPGKHLSEVLEELL